MGRKRIIVGAVALAVAVVTGVALAVVVPRLRAGQDTPPPVTPIAATLRVVTPAALVGQEAELVAAAVSRRPLVRFELWSGGERVAEARPVSDGNRAVALLRWAPRSAGTHLVVLRAIDDLGHAAHAAPVRMRTAEPPEASVPLRNGFVGPSLRRHGLAAAPADLADPAAPTVTTVVEGCTVRISADAGSLPTLALFIAAPGLPGFQSLGYGDTGHTEASVPLAAGDVAVYALGYGGQESAASPIVSVVPPAECADSRWQGDVSLVDGLLLSQPGPPDIAYLYLSVDGGPWQRVPAQDQTFIRRRNGVLDFSRVLPPLGAAKRIDVEAWSHDGTGAYKVGSGTLVAGEGEETFMPVLVGVLPATDLDIVVTHRVPDFKQYETLERYGEIHAYEEVTGPAPSNQPRSSITIAPPEPDFEFAMRWQPKVLGITHGVWQVSAVPLGSAPLTAPGVLLSGTVPVTQLDFDLDFAPLVSPVAPAPALPENEPAAAGALTYADYSSGLQYTDLVPPAYEMGSANAPMAPYVDTGGAPAAPGTKVAITPPKMSPYEFVQWLHPEYLYVRIIPMAGAQPVDAISNTVTFRLYLEDPTPYVPPPPPTVDVHVEFQRPYLPDAQFTHCVRVVENKFATPANPGANPPPPGMKALAHKYKPAPVGATVCPEKPSSDDDFDPFEVIEDVVGGVVEFWDTIVMAYDYLKGQVVDLLVDVSGCGEVFPLDFVPEDACQAVAKYAVDAVLMYFGIPPSLPNSSELYAVAEGQLTDALYEWAAVNGISCPEELEEKCKEQLQKMLDEVVSEAKVQASKAAHASATSVGTLWLNPEILVVPEPRGTLQPAIFTTTFTRKLDAIDDATVPEKASPAYLLQGVRPDWHWYDYDNKQQIEHQTVIGTPLTSSGGASPPVLLRQLAPGESTTVVKVLDRPAIWFEPGADPTVKLSGTNNLIQVHSDFSHWWVLMTGGAKLTAYGGPYANILVDSWTATQWGTQP